MEMYRNGNDLFFVGEDNFNERNLGYGDKIINNRVLLFFIEVIFSVLYLKKYLLVIRKVFYWLL